MGHGIKSFLARQLVEYLESYLEQMFGCSNSNKMIVMIMMWFHSKKEKFGQITRFFNCSL